MSPLPNNSRFRERAEPSRDPKIALSKTVMSEKLIHILSIREESTGQVRARAIVRLGSVNPGDEYWFEGIDRVRRSLRVIDFRQGPHLATVLLEGKSDDLDALQIGMYLYGESFG